MTPVDPVDSPAGEETVQRYAPGSWVDPVVGLRFGVAAPSERLDLVTGWTYRDYFSGVPSGRECILARRVTALTDALAAAEEREAKAEAALAENGLAFHQLIAADAALATVTAERDEARRERDEEARPREANLRRMLWLGHGCSGSTLYGDDGEMSCGGCRVDFKRDPVEQIEAAIRSRNESQLVRELGLLQRALATINRLVAGDTLGVDGRQVLKDIASLNAYLAPPPRLPEEDDCA